MAADAPLSRLVLAATSVADDLGYVALADLSRALEGAATSYRIIGGHMVSALVARWRLGAELYRERATPTSASRRSSYEITTSSSV